MRFISLLTACLIALLLAACGGGGGAPGLSSGTSNPLLTTAPATLNIAVSASLEYGISGGKPPYKAASSNVQVSVVSVIDNRLTIGGVASGTTNIIVTDVNGLATTIAVTVGNLQVLYTTAAATINVGGGSTTTFTVGGGVPGYTVSSTDSRIATATINGNTLAINGLVTGNATITVTDTKGDTKSIAVSVANFLLYTTAPPTLTIAKDTQRAFIVGGGTPGYSVESTDPRIVAATLSGTTLVLRGVGVNNAAGSTTTVIVRDSDRQSVSLTVTVGGDSLLGLFTTAPSPLTMAKDTQTTFAVGGGVAPYRLTNDDVRIASASLVGTALNINAVALGTANLSIFDSAGNSVPVVVNVKTTATGAFFTSAPAALAMGAGTSLTFQVGGGSLPYAVASTDARIATGSSTSSTFTITASTVGTATVQIQDALGAKFAVVVTVDGTSTGVAGPAFIDILPSNNTISSASNSKVTFIVTVKDGNNNAMANQTVSFVATSGTLSGSNPSPKTDATGTISTVSLTTGSDASLRTIAVTASSGSVSKSISIPVTGTTLSISGAGSAIAGSADVSYTVKALDSAGKSIVGVPLAFSSALGNTVSPQTATTDVSGAATFNVTPSVVGTDTLTVSGQGTAVKATLAVSNQDFSFIAPIPTTNLLVNTANTISVQYKVGGVGVAGQTVTVNTTRGFLPSSPVVSTTAVTNASGIATVTSTSATAGPVTFTAQLGAAQTSVTAAYIATIPATIGLQANPNAVLPNASGSTTNQSSLVATVRDASNNPVSGQVVLFTATVDGSNGSIVPASATTDSSGTATAQFIPGPLSTAANGVTLQAVVQGFPAVPAAKATLTVNGSALFLAIGVGNTLNILDSVTYEKDFSVLVTDANGVPSVGRVITVSVVPTGYKKGSLGYTANGWGYRPAPNAPQYCANEDVNLNGILDPGEDINGNGKLEPGGPAVLIPTNLTTDTNGFATFKVRYAKNYALWVDTLITATALVSGTESKRSVPYSLQMAASEANVTASPANQFSPFGTVLDCANPN